jgi:hypothetical protein
MWESIFPHDFRNCSDLESSPTDVLGEAARFGKLIHKATLKPHEPRLRSRYSYWLRAGRPRSRSSCPGRVRIFTSPYRPNRLWDPPDFLSNGYRGLFPRGVKRQGREADHHLQLVPGSRKPEPIHLLPHRSSWRCAWLLRTGTTFFSFLHWNITLHEAQTKLSSFIKITLS